MYKARYDMYIYSELKKSWNKQFYLMTNNANILKNQHSYKLFANYKIVRKTK